MRSSNGFVLPDRASRQARDGLDYRCLNSSRLAFWLAGSFPRLLQFSMTRPMLRRIYRRQLGLVPSIGMLAGPFGEAEDAFQTGRFLMRFWLELAKRDLYLHPYGNLVLCRVNQDFREATKTFDRSCVEIEIYGFDQGPFSERDIRIKNKYVAE